MKNLKKLASLVLSVMMILSLTISLAEDPETGSITINGISVGNIYSIYKLLDLESYNTTSGAYSYKVNSAWSAFFATDECKKYFAVDNTSYATWIAAEDDATVAAFAKSALAYAQANDIASVASSNNAGTVTGNALTFDNLTLGYYLVDSTMGALCGLTTTNPDASINAKNGQPTIIKQVQEDSTNNFGDTNSADFDQPINFRTTINVHAGAQNYVLHDEMSDGLTFVFDKEKPYECVKAYHVVSGSGDQIGTEVPPEYYTIKTEGLTDKCTFEVHFTQEFCDHLGNNDKVLVFYSAKLNENAVVASDGNDNKTKLHFGENHVTTEDSTKTYTYGFDLVKTDSQNRLLPGAAFRIYDAATDGNEVPVVKREDGSYRRAMEGETGEDIEVTNGLVSVVGFDNGTYYLEEVKTPDGFNQLASRHSFTIADGYLQSIFNGNIYSTGSGVHVVNKSGTMLPETGGMGTTLFYIVGGVLVVAAVVVLITKKRMQNVD